MDSCFEDTNTIDENHYLESILRLFIFLNVERMLIWRLEVLRPYLSDSNTPENFNVLKLQCVQESRGFYQSCGQFLFFCDTALLSAFVILPIV